MSKKVDEEALHFNARLKIIIALILCVASLIVCCISLFINVANVSENTPTPDVMAATTENIPTETSVPVTEETIPAETETTPTEVEETVPEAPEAPVWADTSLKYGYTDRDLLAIAIYQEAGSNRTCDECRRRVADVVLNRVMSDKFPDNIHDVLTQYMQYGTLWKTGIQWPERSTNIYEKDAVARAYRIADEILAGQHSELYGRGYVYQAEFKQGSEGMWCCGTYFAR